MTRSLPLVYACAGCSYAGQVAYDLAQELSRRQAAEMSCLAGLAAELPVFLRVLQGRQAWVIDGCPLECAKCVFDKLGMTIHRHIRLREYGVPKNGSSTAAVADIAAQVCQGAHEGALATTDASS